QFESEVYKYAEAKGVTTSNFDKLVAGYGILTARNFSISFEIDSDPVENIAASDQAGEIGNNHDLLKLIEMRHNTHMFMEGTGEDFIKTLISTMGVDGQQASIYLGIQEGVVKQIEGRRQSISGVSLNEEMVNLVKYQQVYGAAAKMIQAYSEVLDILINRLGV
ncbi:MAG TPA: flagellar basal body rod C-terminal domain-containing protein, partial [Thermoclostridium caenicola]|nr:flagellar basal body rod C-terminal domain-containing protein [Thermoclostridium caenicola]